MGKEDLSPDEIACGSQKHLQSRRQLGTDRLSSEFPNETVIIHRPSYFPWGYDKLLVRHPYLRPLPVSLPRFVPEEGIRHFENKDDD